MVMPYHVLLVEDEPLARDELRYLLSYHSDIKIVAEAETTEQAKQLLQQHKNIDGIFLDIEIYGESEQAGLDFAFILKQQTQSPWIVFVSAYKEQFGLKAYDTFPITFLAKPIDTELLNKTLHTIRKRYAPNQRTIKINYRNKEDSYNQVIFIQPQKIVYVSKNNCENSVRLKLSTGKILEKVTGILTMDNNTLDLTKLENWLLLHNPLQRIHKSHLVNVEYINGWRNCDDEKHKATFHDYTDELPIGDSYFNAFKEYLMAR